MLKKKKNTFTNGVKHTYFKATVSSFLAASNSKLVLDAQKGKQPRPSLEISPKPHLLMSITHLLIRQIKSYHNYNKCKQQNNANTKGDRQVCIRLDFMVLRDH